MVELIVLVVVAWFLWLFWRASKRRVHRPQPPPIRSSTATRSGVGTPQGPQSSQAGSYATTGEPPSAGWVPTGKEVTVAGYRIPGGMIYLGQNLPTIARYGGVEPALIVPRLPVDSAQPDRSGSMMPYWPSYSTIPPASRAAYLEWLAGGRGDPSFGIGHVFLFFYGLERRTLFDAQHSKEAQQEFGSIVEEIDRLLQIYGSNGSFRSYAGSLAAFLKVATSDASAYTEAPPLTIAPGFEFPLQVRIALGQLSLEGKPVPADWALAWYRSAPSTRLRTPAHRCPEELAMLFRTRYRERFGEGITVRPNQTKIRASYRPASASFGGQVSLSFTDSDQRTGVPDVTALQGPLTKITEIAEGCVSDLEPYSRWIGKNPTLCSSPAGIALLPGELVVQYRSEEVDGLCAAIERRLGASTLEEIPLVDLLEHWASRRVGKLQRADAVLLAQLLEKRGYGLEPDPRFGGPLPTVEQAGVVFRLPQGSPSAPSATFAAATVTLQLAVSVAAADDHVSPSELNLLEQHLVAALPVTPQERVRLRAQLRWLLMELPATAGLKKKLELLDPSQRSQIGHFLVAVATADGQIEPHEVTMLTRLYKFLDLDPNTVYSEVHEHSVVEPLPAAGPVTVRPAGGAPTGYAVAPPPKTPLPRPVALDMGRVEARLAQTATVSALLSSIFAEDEPILPREVGAGSEGRAGLGLDQAHSALLRALSARPSWTRIDLEALAAEHSLLPDGAIDAINEASMELCGEPVCEGDDPIAINPEALKELLP